MMYILQLGFLCKYRNFLGYLIIQVACTIFNNLVQNYIAVKKYPYLKNKTIVKAHLDKRALVGNVKATFLFKVSDTILDQTDNIIISAMIGTVAVGMYSNYYMLIVYLVNIAGIIANGMVASYGNLYVEGNTEKSHTMFKVSMLLFSLYGTVCSVCYICLIQDFIPIWVGRQYLMGNDLVYAIIVVFYLRMVTNTVWIYRSAMGLFVFRKLADRKVVLVTLMMPVLFLLEIVNGTFVVVLFQGIETAFILAVVFSKTKNKDNAN